MCISIVPGLKSADGIDFGDVDDGSECFKCLAAPLADFAVAADDHLLAAEHHVGGSLETVDDGLLARIQIVKLGFRHGIVHVHRRNSQFVGFRQLVKTVHSGHALLDDTFQTGKEKVDKLRNADEGKWKKKKTFDQFEHGRIFLEDQVGGITSVVQNHIGLPILGCDATIDAPPEILLRFTTPSENGESCNSQSTKKISGKTFDRKMFVVKNKSKRIQKNKKIKVYQLQPELQPPRSG